MASTSVNGWFVASSPRGTTVRLADGRDLFDSTYHTSRLIFGTPVQCTAVAEHYGTINGRIDQAFPLGEMTHDRRPLAILDGSNLASGNNQAPDYCRVFSLAWMFDAAGWQPIIVDDPGSTRFYLNVDFQSASALTRIRYSPLSFRWRRIVIDWGTGLNNADETGLLYLRNALHRHREARFVTFDQFRDDALVHTFPELDDDDFLSRIVAPHIVDDIIAVPGLGIPPMRIPHPLFQPSQRDVSSYS